MYIVDNKNRKIDNNFNGYYYNKFIGTNITAMSCFGYIKDTTYYDYNGQIIIDNVYQITDDLILSYADPLNKRGGTIYDSSTKKLYESNFIKKICYNFALISTGKFMDLSSRQYSTGIDDIIYTDRSIPIVYKNRKYYKVYSCDEAIKLHELNISKVKPVCNSYDRLTSGFIINPRLKYLAVYYTWVLKKYKLPRLVKFKIFSYI